MKRKFWITFIVIQSAGLICSWAWTADLFGSGAAMWGTGFICLLPGHLASGFVVEKLLWDRGLTLRQLGIIEIPLILVFNGFAWLLCLKLIRAFGRKVNHKRREHLKAGQGRVSL